MSHDDQPLDDELLAAARDVLLDHDARRAAGEDVDFEALCRAHPRLEPALRRAVESDSPLRLDPKPGEVSLAERLQRHLGADVAPRVCLPSEPGTPDVASGSGGRYRVLGEIGRGGMGSVFRVWDAELRRHLAVKVSHARPFPGRKLATMDEQLLARFLEEAQVTSQLEHPGIVPVHDLGLDGEGRVYFAMRLVRGRNLGEIFELAWTGAEEWSRARLLDVIVRVCETLSYAHEKGVIHRDIKPSNVMIGRFGEVYVMDWGVARILGVPARAGPRPKFRDSATVIRPVRSGTGSSGGSNGLDTLDGDVVGTPAYMAPEQARGDQERVSARSDVYSVGALLYHLLARRKPFVPPDSKLSPPKILLRVLEGPPQALVEIDPTLPGELVAICEKAMAREPAKRYASTAELADDLRAFAEGRVVRAFERGVLAELRKWTRRNRALSATAAALVLAIVAAGAWLYVDARSDRERAVENSEALREQRDEARTQRENADAVLDFFTSTLVRQDPDSAGGRDVRLREALDHVSEQLPKLFEERPAVAAKLSASIGHLYTRLGQYELADALLAKALETSTAKLGEDSEAARDLRAAAIALCNSRGDFSRATQLVRDELRSAERRGDKRAQLVAHVDLLMALAPIPAVRDEARRECETVERLSAELGVDLAALAPGTVSVMTNFLLREKRCDEIRRWVRSLEEHGDVAAALNSRINLAGCLVLEQRLGEATAELERVVADAERLVPGDSTLLSSALAALAGCLRTENRVEEAAAALARLLDVQRESLGASHVVYLMSVAALARIRAQIGLVDEAESVLLGALRELETLPAPETEAGRQVLYAPLVEIALGAERWQAAETYALELLALPCSDPQASRQRRDWLACARERRKPADSAAK